MAASVKKRAAATESAAIPRASKSSAPETVGARSAAKSGAIAKPVVTPSTKKVTASKGDTKKPAISGIIEAKPIAKKEKNSKAAARDIGKAAGTLKTVGQEPIGEKSTVTEVATDKSSTKTSGVSKTGAADGAKKVTAQKRVEAEPAAQNTVVVKAPKKVAKKVEAASPPTQANSSLAATSGAKSVLNPSGAWPFPTGNRPK